MSPISEGARLPFLTGEIPPFSVRRVRVWHAAGAAI